MSKLKDTASKSLHNGSRMASSMKPQSSAISEISSIKGTPKAIRGWLMELQRDSHVSRSHLQEKEKEDKTREICGRQRLNAFALYDHDSHSWRTFQVSVLTCTLCKFSGTWPKHGIMQDGVCWGLMTLVPHTRGKGCGYWPTPTAPRPHDNEKTAGKYFPSQKQKDLVWAVANSMWPTPNARDATRDVSPKRDRLPDAVGSNANTGRLNPTWVEWLMGWPMGWTGLKPLAMDRFQRWLRLHIKYYGG